MAQASIGEGARLDRATGTSIRVVEDDAGFKALGDVWDDLEKRTPGSSPFLAHGWVTTWWQHFGSRDQLRILVASRDGNVAGIAPLMLRQRFGFRLLQFMGRPLSDYCDFLVPDDSDGCTSALLRFIDTEMDWDRLVLEAVPEPSPILPALAAWSERNLLRLNTVKLAPYVPIATSWDEYMSTRRTKLRTDTNRRMRRLEREGPVAFERCAQQADALAALAVMSVQKSHRYVSTGARDILADGKTLAFFRDVTTALWPKGYADVAILRVDGDPVAVHFGFKRQGRFFYYMPSFDARFERFSVGRLLNQQLLEWCFRGGFAEFDFMAGDHAYKYEWASQHREVHRLASYRRNPKGLALYIRDRAEATVRDSARVRATAGAARRARSRLAAGVARLRHRDGRLG